MVALIFKKETMPPVNDAIEQLKALCHDLRAIADRSPQVPATVGHLSELAGIVRRLLATSMGDDDYTYRAALLESEDRYTRVAVERDTALRKYIDSAKVLQDTVEQIAHWFEHHREPSQLTRERIAEDIREGRWKGKP